MEESTPAEARAGDWSRDFVGATEPVASVTHTFIPGPTADLPTRIYRPEGEGPLPAIVYFHGSAFTVSNIGLADSPHRAIANRTGCVVVAVNYQKAPEHPFPTPMDDAYAATRWVVENAAALNLDPTRIGVGGDSAGGNLAAAVCIRARDENGPSIAFQLLLYPAVEHESTFPSMTENAEGYLLSTGGVRWAWNNYLASPEDGENPLASPLKAQDLSRLPAAIVATAEFDPLRDEGEAYAARLDAAGVPVIRRRYSGMIHGFLWTAGVIDGSRELLNDLGTDVRSIIAG
ncbi:MAG: alpha/beta hydrolase fold-3 domain protein [Microbacteriaceae bacterium]|nr:alpha/beta hydrolase fold-3 domain protein [Microbacteriaceae bacterium]